MSADLDKIKTDAINAMKDHAMHLKMHKKNHKHGHMYNQQIHNHIYDLRKRFTKAVNDINSVATGAEAEAAINEVRQASIDAVSCVPALRSDPCPHNQGQK